MEDEIYWRFYAYRVYVCTQNTLVTVLTSEFKQLLKFVNKQLLLVTYRLRGVQMLLITYKEIQCEIITSNMCVR